MRSFTVAMLELRNCSTVSMIIVNGSRMASCAAAKLARAPSPPAGEPHVSSHRVEYNMLGRASCEHRAGRVAPKRQA